MIEPTIDIRDLEACLPGLGGGPRSRVCAALTVLLCASACGNPTPSPADSPAPDAPLRGQVSGPASPPEDGWRTATPGSVGMDGEALDAMSRAIRGGEWGNIHAILVERSGRLVHEAYFTGRDYRYGEDLGVVEFDATVMHDIRSVTKSVMALLVGIALGSGDIESVDVELARLLPDRADGIEESKRAITLHHVLSMSSGLDWNEALPYSDPRNDERRLMESEDPIGFVLARPLAHEPGSVWIYSSGDTHLLGAILERATGLPVEEYAARVLFEPLGIEETMWMGDVGGMPAVGSGLRLRARDLAKTGSLILHRGNWRGRQIVPAGWIDVATAGHIANPDPSSPDFLTGERYGYQWWVNEFTSAHGPVDVIAAVGNGGQRIFVLPDLELVITVLAGDYDDPRHFWTPEYLVLEHVLPAVVAAE